MKKIFFTLFLFVCFITGTTNHTLADTITIKTTSEATARFTLQNGQTVKYITFPKDQPLLASKEDNSWHIKVGNGTVMLSDRFVKTSSKKITTASIKNKVEINTIKPASIYSTHAKKDKPLATLAANMRISSNGLKGDFYEVTIGGHLGYIHRKDAVLDTGVPVLIYHHFVKDLANSIYKNNASVFDIDLFEEQMNYLTRKGFTAISLKDLDLWMQHKQLLPAKAVVLTFDDANLSVEKLIYPILKRKNMFATTFVIGDRVNDTTPEFNMEKIQFAGFTELRKMRDVFDLEYHTYGLHTFNSIANKGAMQFASNSALNYDFMHAYEVFYKIDPTLEPRYFAYPYGKYVKSQESILIKNHVSLAFLNKGGKAKVTSPRLYVPRTPVQNTMTLKQFAQAINN